MDSVVAADIRVSTNLKCVLSRFLTARDTVVTGIPVALDRRRMPNLLSNPHTHASVDAGFCENLIMDEVYRLAVQLSSLAVKIFSYAGLVWASLSICRAFDCSSWFGALRGEKMAGRAVSSRYGHTWAAPKAGIVADLGAGCKANVRELVANAFRPPGGL